MNEVNAHRARLVPGWVTVFGRVYQGVKLWRIPPDLRSGTSCLRSTTSNNRSCASQLRSGTFFLGSNHPAQFIFEYFSLCMMFCKKCSHWRLFCHCVCPRLVWINAARLKHYLKAITVIKAKQSALNARKPLVGRREPHLCSLPFRPRAYRDPPPLAE